MKKALLVLLFLVLAGGLFAQVTWNARYYGGFRIDFSEDNDPTVRLYNDALGAYRNEGRLYMTYRNDAGTLGGAMQLRANVSGTGGGTPTFNNIHTFYGWFTLFDGKVKLNIGKWTDAEFNEQYWWAGWTYWASSRPGVAAYFYPTDELRLGFGLATVATTTATTLFEDELRYWFGIAYRTSDWAVYLNGQYQKDNVHFALSGFYDVDPILVIPYADFMYLDQFDTKGTIDFGFVFGFYGVENLDIELTPEMGIKGNGDDPDVSVALDFGYYLDVGGIKKVGLNTSFDIMGESLTLTPYVTYGMASARNYIRLGYKTNIGFDGSFNSGLFLDYLFRF